MGIFTFLATRSIRLGNKKNFQSQFLKLEKICFVQNKIYFKNFRF